MKKEKVFDYDLLAETAHEIVRLCWKTGHGKDVELLVRLRILALLNFLVSLIYDEIKIFKKGGKECLKKQS